MNKQKDYENLFGDITKNGFKKEIVISTLNELSKDELEEFRKVANSLYFAENKAYWIKECYKYFIKEINRQINEYQPSITNGEFVVGEENDFIFSFYGRQAEKRIDAFNDYLLAGDLKYFAEQDDGKDFNLEELNEKKLAYI